MNKTRTNIRGTKREQKVNKTGTKGERTKPEQTKNKRGTNREQIGNSSRFRTNQELCCIYVTGDAMMPQCDNDATVFVFLPKRERKVLERL